MNKVFERPASLSDRHFSYCSGCGHSIVHRLIAEVIDELGIAGRTIGVAPVGCAVTAYDFFRIDFSESAHGRAAAVATGIKRSLPDRVVFTYQGDGDLAAIGLSETIHAANRGENITVIFINNTVYGMTSGQMAPTTLIGQKTATSPYGRSAERFEGYPMKMAEMVGRLEAPAYVVRTSVSSLKGVVRTKKAVLNAFKLQVEGGGYSFVEVLSQCPTNLGITPVENNRWIDENLTKQFPLGIYKDKFGLEGAPVK
jgi:2-oxoglutarate ferredoxin oxidoreductase subunit beta